MSWFRNSALPVAAATLGLAAILGGSLGIATAGFRGDLSAGLNPTVGGPLQADTPPAEFLGCLEADSWRGLYLFNSATQKWFHYFNTTGPNAVPAYVNNAAAGGITTIPRLSGVALIMNEAVDNAFLRDAPGQACPD